MSTLLFLLLCFSLNTGARARARRATAEESASSAPSSLAAAGREGERETRERKKEEALSAVSIGRKKGERNAKVFCRACVGRGARAGGRVVLSLYRSVFVWVCLRAGESEVVVAEEARAEAAASALAAKRRQRRRRGGYEAMMARFTCVILCFQG